MTHAWSKYVPLKTSERQKKPNATFFVSGERHLSVLGDQRDGVLVTVQPRASCGHPHPSPPSLLNHNHRHHPAQLYDDDHAFE